jgi:esterase/lipase
VRLVKAKNKPFDIGHQIINQATGNEDLKQEWANDPFNRLALSPKELVDFQAFMNQNKSAAAKIKNLPVLFFQGGQDKLVKAEGTMQIFNEIPSKDKDLVLIGSSEHLIFEEGQFGLAVVNGVTGWILAHLPEQDKITAAN